MNEFKTELDLAGETRQARVLWGAACDDIYLGRIEISLVVDETYTTLGVYDPRPITIWLDVTEIISDRQALALTRKIKAAAEKARAEDYHDSDMQDWEERQRYARAA